MKGQGQGRTTACPPGTARGPLAQERAQQRRGQLRETAELPGDQVAVRNSRHPKGPALIFSQAEVRAFLEGVKDGDFDDLLQ
jgi:hypothetical protein